MVKCSDPISEKVVHLVAKFNALDECMVAVKKAYEKDSMDLKEYLQGIRTLSVKQCKQLNKMNKIS